jgi:hypothetical protein
MCRRKFVLKANPEPFLEDGAVRNVGRSDARRRGPCRAIEITRIIGAVADPEELAAARSDVDVLEAGSCETETGILIAMTVTSKIAVLAAAKSLSLAAEMAR